MDDVSLGSAGPAMRGLAPSDRSRTWARRSRGSGRELLPMPWDDDCDTEMHAESGLEGKGILGLQADPRVVRVWEQPPAIRYRDGHGAWRTHTVDLLALMRDGTRTAFIVKPSKKREAIQLLMQLLAEQAPTFADLWVHLHEGKLTRDVERRGQAVYRVRLDGPFGDDPSVAVAAALATGPMRIRDLVAAGGGRVTFWSAVRLVADGRLVTPDGHRLDMDTVVAPAGWTS